MGFIFFQVGVWGKGDGTEAVGKDILCCRNVYNRRELIAERIMDLGESDIEEEIGIIEK